MSAAEFLGPKHGSFFRRCLDGLPQPYQTLDTTRMTIVFFSVSGLDLLGQLESLSPERREEIVDWIYSQQLCSSDVSSTSRCGWRGWSWGGRGPGGVEEETGQLAISYSALATLLVLGDDLGKVDRDGLKAMIAASQLPDGSFSASPDPSEHDVRFVYCAVVLARLLLDWSPIHVLGVLRFIRRCINYDGGFGQRPGCESHGGSTYCVIATLSLLGELGQPFLSAEELRRLRRWLCLRQATGFHGRTNKPDDSCYTFWVGASLALLGDLPLVDAAHARNFTLSCQDSLMGGFGKFSDSYPDALHSYLSLGGLSLLGEPGIEALDPGLNLSRRVALSLGPSPPLPSPS